MYTETDRPVETLNKGRDERAWAGNLATRSQGAIPYSDKRESLRGRIEEARRRGNEAAERYQAAERAAQIIDKNPEFAELLDLIQRF